MENIILVAHLVIALVIIGLILLQQGKGAEMGASFGSGSSQTLFGASGSGNFFAKMTALAAALFFATSFTLAVIAKNQSGVGDVDSFPLLEESDLPVLQEAEQDVPVLESVEPASDDVPAAPAE